MNHLSKFIVRLGLALGALLLLCYLLLPRLIVAYSFNTYSWKIGEVNLNWNSLEMKDLYSGDQSTHISSVLIHFTAKDLLLGRLSEVMVKGVKLTPKVEEDLAFEIPNVIGQLDRIPADISHFEIQEISVVFPVAHFIAETFQINGNISGSLDKVGGHQLFLTSTILPTPQSKGGRINLTLAAGKLTADLSIEEVRLKDIPVALTLSVKAEQTFGAPLHVNALITNENHEIFLKIDGGFSGPSAGLFSFKVPSLELDSQKLPLRIFGHDVLNKIASYSMVLKGEGTLAWEDARFTPSGKLIVEKGNFLYETINVKGVSFKVPIEHVWPKIATQQKVFVDIVESPIMNLSQLELNLVMDDSIITLAQAKGNVWGGKAQLTSCVLWPLPSEQSLMLTLDKISLQPLLTHLELQKVTANGLLDGKIPIRIFGDHSLAIENGLMSSVEPGYVAYQWDAALQSTDSNLLLAAKALQNFTYQEGKLDINKPRYKELELVLDIKGKNPKLLEGRSFDFKINLTGKILEALEATIQSFEADIKDLKKQAK